MSDPIITFDHVVKEFKTRGRGANIARAVDDVSLTIDRGDIFGIIGYSGAGKAVALPALVKTLEMSRPFQCAATIFLLMLLYTLVLALLMLLMKLLRGKSAGVVAAFGFSLYGLLLNPELIKQMFNLPDELMYKANVAVGWLSPLNQATYYMHNFGYDLLPRLWQTYAIFGGLIALLMGGILLAIRRYNFMFLGTEQS